MTKHERNELWLRLLWTCSLADHLGDVAEALEAFGKKSGLSMPPEEISGIDLSDGEALREWIDGQGIKRGIHGD